MKRVDVRRLQAHMMSWRAIVALSHDWTFIEFDYWNTSISIYTLVWATPPPARDSETRRRSGGIIACYALWVTRVEGEKQR